MFYQREAQEVLADFSLIVIFCSLIFLKLKKKKNLKNASTNCKQLAFPQRNRYRVLPLATVAAEKPRFRADAAIFAIGVQFYPTILVVLATVIVSSTLLRYWTIKPYCYVKLWNLFITLTEGTPQSTFSEYFWAINTIKKTFTRGRTHFTNLWLLLVYSKSMLTA